MPLLKFSKILSRPENRSEKEKEKEAEAEAHRNSSQNGSLAPPPAYSAAVQDADDELLPPDLTAGFRHLSVGAKNQDSFPNVEEAVAHLKLLECFYRLRQKVGSTDGLFGISDKLVPEDAGTDKDELRAKLAEKRWACYLHVAVEHYDHWLRALFPNAQMAHVNKLDDAFNAPATSQPGANDGPLRFTEDNLPPIHVLLVWHAHMLNPRAYLEDCLRYGIMRMYYTDMPWQAVANSIDSESFLYQPGEACASAWFQLTGHDWEHPLDREKREFGCPDCYQNLAVPWTTCTSYEPAAHGDLRNAIETMLASGEGFCDKGFVTSCVFCHTSINHDQLRAAKFTNDVKNLITRGVPMAGTVLGVDGVPKGFPGHKVFFAQANTFDNNIKTFPNNVLVVGLGAKIVAVRSSDKTAYNSIEAVRTAIEEVLADKNYVRKARQAASPNMTRAERVGIRRMLSRYWENSSPFALDLVGAVVRQGAFVEKMHHIDWLHSPALPNTMRRLIVKYERFVHIMADKSHMAVPTLDVDLAWHTHQLSPFGYISYTVLKTQQFIDHDDKVAETALNDGFAWTSKTYQRLFGEPYSECTCWYCEAVRESYTNPATRLFSGSSSRATDTLLHSAPSNPLKSAHISAHNAVRPTDDTGKYDRQAKRQADAIEKAYQKAKARAIKNGRDPPKRNDYYYSEAYGYPVYMPLYTPFYGPLPYAPIVYPVNPGCMSISPGVAGNCCVGTCGGGVAAGACAGSGGAGCAGGAAGGCGGGGGIGGGCGGGGGGGGAGCGGGGGGGCGGGGGG